MQPANLLDVLLDEARREVGGVRGDHDEHEEALRELEEPRNGPSDAATTARGAAILLRVRQFKI